MNGENGNPQIPEEIAPKAGDTSFAKRAGKRVWEAIRSLPGEFLSFWKSYPPKARKIAAIVAAVVLVIGAAWTIFGSDNAHRGFYLKNGELYMCTSAGHTRRITDDLIVKGNESSFTELCLSAKLNQYIHLSKDGIRLFYIDHTTVEYPDISEGAAYFAKYDLYWVDLTTYPGVPVKIAENIKGRFYVNSQGDLVTYFIGQTMYQYNMVVSIPVAENILYYSSVHALDDGNTFLYVTREKDGETGTLYRKKGVGFPEKIDEGVSVIASYTENMSTIVYTKNEDLYMKEGIGAPKLIAENSVPVSGVYADNSLYYSTRNRTEISYKAMDFVVDDWVEESYRGKSHKTILQELGEEEVVRKVYDLWYFDGKKSVKITDNAVGFGDSSTSGKAKILFQQYPSELPQVKLSDMIADCNKTDSTNIYQIYPDTLINGWVNEIWEKTSYHICTEDRTELIPLEAVADTMMNENGTTVYMRADFTENNQELGNLYRIDVSGNSIGEPELLTGGVADYSSIGFLSNDVYICWVRNSENTSDFYVNGVKVDTNVKSEIMHGLGTVLTSGVQYNEKTGMLYYLKGYTLMQYDGKKSQKIKDDVREFVFTEAGDVFFLPEVDEKNELWCWNGKKLVKVDTDVGYLIPLKGQEK